MSKPPAVSVYAAIERRLREQAPGDGAPLVRLRRRGAKESRRAVDVWRRLAGRVDPAQFRPKLAPDIEVKEFKLRWGNDYAMIANPRAILHYRLEPYEVELLPLMDGTRTLKQIVVERLRSSGDLDLAGVWDLVRQLHIGGFLEQPFVDTDAALARALRPAPRFVRKLREFARSLTLEWKKPDAFVRWLYTHGLKHVFRARVLVPGAVVAALGFSAFVALVRSHRFSLGGSRPALEGLLLLSLNFFLTFSHELGHAVALVHFGRRVKGAGFMIYFGSPAFFVEASDSLMLDRRQRIAQSFAGPYTEMMLAGAASLAAWLAPSSPLAPLFYKFAVLNYFTIFANLIPLLELDGYWILSDVIQVPDLRPRSLSFVRHDLWHKLRARDRFSPQEIGLSLYGILGVGFTLLTVGFAFFFWRTVFGGLITTMWRAGIVERVILLALIAFVAGPLIRGTVSLARAGGRHLRGAWRALRFRLETRWRVEAAELIDSLPMFRDLPEDVLSDLAGRVRLRTVARGRPIVRQGEPAEAFYVVRRGTLQVAEEDPESCTTRPLRTLGRGDAFGELGLLDAAPRAATVRALEEAQVFELDRGAFERLLADAARAPRFRPTVQAMEELRHHPSFEHLEQDQLAELLRHGAWVNIPPAQVILRKGKVGDAFYAIRSGQVAVTEGGKRVATLGPGSYFGEVALLMDIPRTATVRALTPVRAFRVDRDGFDRLVRRAFRRGTLNPQTPVGRTGHH